MIDISTGQKFLSVKKLRELLTELSDDYMLSVNSVGNLTISREGCFIGFIDFNHEAINFNELQKNS